MREQFEMLTTGQLMHHFFTTVDYLEKNKDIQLPQEAQQNFSDLRQELVERRVLTIH
jgi:hypothetical protein